MKAKLAVLATVFSCCGAYAAVTPTPSFALCEHSCGGSWGAYEHAKDYAEKKGWKYVYVDGCWRTSSYGAQWECAGGGWHYGQESFTVWIDEWGYLKHWTET